MRTLAILTLCLLPVAAPAQQRPNWNGAFTAPQASSGQQVYREECQRCHGVTLEGGEGTPELSGSGFLSRWAGKTPGDLLDRTRNTMPTDNPGGLSGSKYEDVVAFTLRANGYTAGTRELGSRTGQNAGKSAEWRYYGGDAGSTKYSPLDQINASNVKNLKVAWRWQSENFGRRPEFNWEVTPLMVGGVLYFTAGTRRDAVAVDAASGETIWMYRLDEGERGAIVARQNHRGVAYWSDGRGDDRILIISPGYQLIALNAKTGQPIASFGKNGLVDLFEGLDRPTVKLGTIGSSSPAIVVKDVIVVGAALQAGVAPPSKENVPGYIRGYDVRTGRRVWTFRTVPHPGDFGNDTWEGDSWKYTGNAGAWAPLSADEELGYVYVPVEMPTGDFYGGHRHGDGLFGESLVCLDARTGKRVWHFQLVHHGVWDWDPPTAPTLLDITVNGKPIKAVAQITKQAWVYVFDRVTGTPVWPIEERPVPQSKAPGEQTSPTQPFPTRPAAFDRQGFTVDDVIDLTPEIKAQALKIVSQYALGPMFTPPSVADADGKRGAITLPSPTGGANWQGGAADPETGMLYVASITYAAPVSLARAPSRTDMDYSGRYSPNSAAELGPQGLPLVKPPWGRITAIDLNTGDHVWMVPNGNAPEYIRKHPALQGVDLSKAGNPEHSPILVTKSLLFEGEGAGMYAVPTGSGGPMFRALDKRTGAMICEMKLPGNLTAVPMTYMMGGRQYLITVVGAPGVPAEMLAWTVQ
ncbi:MAG TPA: PQQ-binding-like beta-propeller repeat protein [Bryobacteraceae bacterium]